MTSLTTNNYTPFSRRTMLTSNFCTSVKHENDLNSEEQMWKWNDELWFIIYLSCFSTLSPLRHAAISDPTNRFSINLVCATLTLTINLTLTIYKIKKCNFARPRLVHPHPPATCGLWMPSSDICTRNNQLMPTSTPGIGPKWVLSTWTQQVLRCACGSYGSISRSGSMK